MSTANSLGGYAFLRGPNFASNGVIALPGMSIHRAVLPDLPELPEGVAAIRRHLARVGRLVSHGQRRNRR